MAELTTPPASAAIDRRSFLRYVGAGALATAAHHALGPLARAATAAVSAGAGPAATDAVAFARFAPVPYPVPIPGDGGDAATDAARLASYVVRDELVLPPGYRATVVAAWGDKFGPTRDVQVGHNADYVGLVPVPGAADEFWLINNHEYVSARPWLAGYEQVHGRPPPIDLATGKLAGTGIVMNGAALDLTPAFLTANPPRAAAIRELCDAAMGDLGVSVLRVRRRPDGVVEVVADSPDHFRIAGHRTSGNVPPENLTFTGPAAPLLGRPRGTFANCSGATTPWGTFLTCEENFQDQVPEFVTPGGAPLPGDKKRLAGGDQPGARTPLPFEFEGLGTGVEPPLDGRQYGWVCEVDPRNRTLKKHTALGRFRHENVAIRCEPGKPLACYMGDDRRGGHVWKFVSRGVVRDPADPANSRLLEDGTLYVARFTADHRGQWVPLAPETPLRRPEPKHCSRRNMWLPRRPEGGHVEVVVEPDGEAISAADWVATIETHCGVTFDEATLADLTAGAPARQVIPLDAYVMANAVGGTPASRPEDVEVHPGDRSVYVAFTDSTGSGEGSPDVRIFPDSAGENSRQYGAIYRLAEAGDDPAATTFTWGKFVSSGEMADGGGGFACADNLAFDPAGDLWMVCDISTPAHNLPVTRRSGDGTNPGNKGFVGVFGNNALFRIPTAGPDAGVPQCFAIGPMECELTGPAFTPDGRSLLIAVQHPGELHGPRAAGAEETRTLRIAPRGGGPPFDQRRLVPLGSNFPGGKPGDVPRSCVVCVTRA